MKHAVLSLCLLMPMPLLAETEERGLSLMGRGAQLFFEGLLNEMEPAIDGFQGFAQEFGPAMSDLMEQMGPAFAELLERVDDMSNYEPPVMLENGDILIKRKPDAPEIVPEMTPGDDAGQGTTGDGVEL